MAANTLQSIGQWMKWIGKGLSMISVVLIAIGAVLCGDTRELGNWEPLMQINERVLSSHMVHAALGI